MIKINLYYNNQGNLWRFKLCGHAEYAEYGNDIVCAAVSMIVINTINSIEALTSETLAVKNDEKRGYIDCTLGDIRINKGSKEAMLLLESMELGLKNIEKDYKDHIQINVHQGGE